MIPKLIGQYLNAMAYLSPRTAGRHGFRLFCYPVRTPLKPHQKEFLETSEQFSFSHQGTKVQGYRWGSGPKKILFLHGWKSHSFRWKNYIEALPADVYTMYAIDAPGHGLSDGKMLNVPIYSDVIEQAIATIGRLDTVVSHSIGSFSLMHALHLNPALPIDKIVVMGAPGEARDFLLLFQQTLKLKDKTLSSTFRHFEKYIGKPVDFFSGPDFAASLQLPGLIIHDRQDAEAPYAYAVQMHRAWKNSTLLTTEELTHNLRSPQVVEAVSSFVQGKYIKQCSTAQGVRFSTSQAKASLQL